MVIPNMIVRALRDEPILVFGDGQQSRCFSGVSDVVRGVLMLAESTAAEGEVFNVGSDEEVTVLELAQRIRRLCESRSSIEFVPYEKVYGNSFEDMRRRVPDLTKVGRFVGYRPEISLNQLLEVTIRDTCERMGVPFPVGLEVA
jgi:UDP-glucose 4-epimerase